MTDWREFTQQVKMKSDIVKTVMEYVELKKRGNAYIGLCPLHHEKTPSFSVNQDKQFFYCFGCHEGGDIFKFLMKMKDISFVEAVRYQAEQIGIPIPIKELTPEDRLKNQLYEINKLAVNFFHNALTMTGHGKLPMKYLHNRGITDKTIEEFQIGCAPNYWNMLLNSFTSKGYSENLLIQAGLIVQGRKNKYDRFRNRVMIPIYDELNRVVGFGGRSIDNQEPKYLNTSETLIFTKKNVVYGLNKASQHIRQANKTVICEGYMDAIALQAAGIKTAVATLGTAFTESHVNLLSRFTKHFYFCYDMDSAGRHAISRAIPITEKYDIDVKVIDIDGKDPDEYLKTHTQQEFEQLIDNATTAFDYQLTAEIQQMSDQTIQSRIKVLQNMLPMISIDNIKRDEQIKQLSNRIFISAEQILYEFIKYHKFGQVNETSGTRKEYTKASVQAARYVLLSLTENKDLISYVDSILPEGFDEPIHQQIYQHIKGLAELTDSAEKELALISNLPVEDKINVFMDSMKYLRLEYLKRQKMKTKDSAEFIKIQKEILDLKQQEKLKN